MAILIQEAAVVAPRTQEAPAAEVATQTGALHQEAHLIAEVAARGLLQEARLTAAAAAPDLLQDHRAQ